MGPKTLFQLLRPLYYTYRPPPMSLMQLHGEAEQIPPTKRMTVF